MPHGRPILAIHISTVGNIRHTLDDRSGKSTMDYPDDEIYDTDGADYLSDEDGYDDLGWPAESDRRWRPVVAIAGAVIATCAIATAVILNSGDTATTKATIAPPAPTPRTLMTHLHATRHVRAAAPQRVTHTGTAARDGHHPDAERGPTRMPTASAAPRRSPPQALPPQADGESAHRRSTA